MLGIDTPQPALDFQRTVFPALSILDAGGRAARAPLGAGQPGRRRARSATSSRARTRSPSPTTASSRSSPTPTARTCWSSTPTRASRRSWSARCPGHLPEGDRLGRTASSTCRSATPRTSPRSASTRTAAGVTVTPDGAPFPTLAADPMPAQLRLGQKLFFSANSDDVPAHAEPLGRLRQLPPRGAQRRRHLEVRAGPARHADQRGRPARHRASSSGPPTATRCRTTGRRSTSSRAATSASTDPPQKPLLDALAAFVNYAHPGAGPAVDRRRAHDRGSALALRAQASSCFDAASAARAATAGRPRPTPAPGNPTLDLVVRRRPDGVLLHDVGTCVTSGAFPDVAHARHRRRRARRLRLRHARAARPGRLRALPPRRQRRDARRRARRTGEPRRRRDDAVGRRPRGAGRALEEPLKYAVHARRLPRAPHAHRVCGSTPRRGARQPTRLGHRRRGRPGGGRRRARRRHGAAYHGTSDCALYPQTVQNCNDAATQMEAGGFALLGIGLAGVIAGGTVIGVQAHAPAMGPQASSSP